MELTCLSCMHTYNMGEGLIYHDAMGFHGVCPDCGASFPVNLPEGPFAIAKADDCNPDNDEKFFTETFPGPAMKEYQVYNTLAQFISAVKAEMKTQDEWCWFLADGVCITAGPCDSLAYEKICAYFDADALGEALAQCDRAKTDETSDWMKEYWDNDGELYRDLDAAPDYDAGVLPDMNRYEIVFDFNGVRRYCFVDAVSMDEALGNFFRNHHNVAYDNIVEHMEV